MSPSASFAWQPGFPPDGSRIASRGFTVNTASRDDVVAFWHAVYTASEGYHERVKWTGTYPNKPGNTSSIFVADVERRINYFRAMCGVPADIRVNSESLAYVKANDRFKPSANLTKAAASQSAAMMIAASYNPQNGTVSGMTHNPDPSVPGWSAEAWNAAANGNLAFGTYGPGAVTEYMVEELFANTVTSEWNSLVGHRRWLLASDSTDFATGDYPGESIQRPPSNVVYVIQNTTETKPLAEYPFVSYPPNGFFPATLNGRFWSLSRKNADFSSATVKVTDASGAEVPIIAVRRDASYGEPAIIWQVGGAAAERNVTADRRFQVSVQGIRGDGIPTSYQYGVTLIDPDLVRRTTPVKGPRIATPGKKVKLKISPVTGARKSRVIQYQRVRKTWVEGGEGRKPDVIAQTSPVYPLLATSAGAVGMGPIAGSKSFNLTFPQVYDLIERGVPDQIKELGPWINTRNGSTLEFLYRRGLMTDATHLVVEVSSDWGITWKAVGKPIKGNEGAKPDVQTFKAKYKLPKSKKPMRVRFRYFHAVEGGPLTSYLDQPGFPTGIFLDEIKLLKCERLVPKKTKVAKRKSFIFRAPKKVKSSAIWVFGLESDFGGTWVRTGPLKTLKVVRK